MPKVTFSIDPREIARWCIGYSKREEQLLKDGYVFRLPEVPEEIKNDLKTPKNVELMKLNKYDASKYFEAFDKVYDEEKHQKAKEVVEKKWRLIEESFFKKAEEVTGKKWYYDKYTCFCSFYGPGGSYRKNKVIIVADKPDAERILAHELIHTLIQEEIEKNKIEQWTKERIVDLYLAKTELKGLFDTLPKVQRAKTSNEVDEIFEKTTNIHEIMKELSKK